MPIDSNPKHCGYREGAIGIVWSVSLYDTAIYQKNHVHIMDALFTLTGWNHSSGEGTLI